MAKRKIKKKNDKLVVGHYLVAFIDLLGQQNHLRNLDTLPNPEKPEDIDTFRHALKNTYGAVTGMRKLFQNFFNVYARQKNDYPEFNGKQKKILNELDSNPIQFQHFSDAIVIYLPLRTDKFKLPTRGIYGVLGAAATTFLCCLAGGHPIRGGIDIGVGMEITKGEIYGSALSRAYALEAKMAKYPRVLIGQELIKYLQATATQEPKDIYETVGKSTADKCLKLIAIDDDGLPFVDYLGDFFKQNIAQNANPELVKRAYSKILEYSAQYQEENNTKMAFRYTLLRNYFEARIQHWFPDEKNILETLHS